MYKIIGADQNEYGPITAGQVRQWMAEGRLNGLSKIQVDGSGVWKQLRDMPEFATLLPPPPPPPITLAAPRPPSPAGPPPANPLAGWALGTGIATLPCCFMPILSLVSIVLGAVAHSQINQNPNQGGRGLATAGIVLGCISLVMAIVFWVIYALFPNASQFSNGFPVR
jgi:hypothetical protein